MLQSKSVGDVSAPVPHAVNLHPFAGKVMSVPRANHGQGLALSKYRAVQRATVSMCLT